MQYSGYPHKYRYEVMSRAFKKENRTKELRTINDTQQTTTATTKKNKNWYDRTKFDGVMFVDVTPDSELQHRIQDACKKNGVKVKVVEKINRTVKSELQRSNPFGWTHCGRGDCPTCNRGIQINCRTRGVMYDIDCLDCLETILKEYRGQTGRSIYKRTKEHIKAWERKCEDSCLHQHSLEYHNGETFAIDVKIQAQCFGKPTTRMITEAVRIEELPDENSLNSKSEWTYVKLPRVNVV